MFRHKQSCNLNQWNFIMPLWTLYILTCWQKIWPYRTMKFGFIEQWNLSHPRQYFKGILSILVYNIEISKLICLKTKSNKWETWPTKITLFLLQITAEEMKSNISVLDVLEQTDKWGEFVTCRHWFYIFFATNIRNIQQPVTKLKVYSLCK